MRRGKKGHGYEQVVIGLGPDNQSVRSSNAGGMILFPKTTRQIYGEPTEGPESLD